MSAISRRAFTRQTLGSLLTMSLLETLGRGDLFADEIKPITTRWINDLQALGSDLKGKKLTQEQWQTKIGELYAQVELADVLKAIDFDKLSRNVKFLDSGALSLRPRFPKVEGLPTDLVFGRQVFALKKGRSVVPHGHNNMATAFLILDGDLHGRHYDRLQGEPDHFIIKPTIDRPFAPGEYSTVSDFKDNIHWFKAVSDQAFIFNIHILGVDVANAEPTGRLYLDPAGEKLSDGLIRARRLDHDEAHQLYG